MRGSIGVRGLAFDIASQRLDGKRKFKSTGLPKVNVRGPREILSRAACSSPLEYISMESFSKSFNNVKSVVMTGASS